MKKTSTPPEDSFQDKVINRLFAETIIWHGPLELWETTVTSTRVCHHRPLGKTLHHSNTDHVVSACKSCQRARKSRSRIYQQLVL